MTVSHAFVPNLQGLGTKFVLRLDYSVNSNYDDILMADIEPAYLPNGVEDG